MAHEDIHAASHQNGGGDEISVAGLSGELADLQPPKTHAGDHSDGGGDEVTVENLATSGAVNTVPTSDGAGGLTMAVPSGGGGYVIGFGAICNTAGYYLRPWASSADVDGTWREFTQWYAPHAGTITRMSWNTADGDATTDFKIRQNGTAAAYTLSNAGQSGVDTTINLAVAQGDLIGVEWDGGTQPNGTQFNLFFEPT